MTCVVGTSDGAELGSAGHEYAHAAMERTLASSGAALPPHWALQDLADCIKALQRRSRPRCARSGSAGEGARKASKTAVMCGTRTSMASTETQRARHGGVEGTRPRIGLLGTPQLTEMYAMDFHMFQYRPGAVTLATLVSLGGERYGQARPDSGQFAVA